MKNNTIRNSIYQRTISNALERIQHTDDIEEAFSDVLHDVLNYFNAGRVSIMASDHRNNDLQFCVFEVVQYLKGITGRKMYEKFPDLRQQLWKGELWNHSYYLETIGDISEETIRKYIEHQSKQY